MPTVETLHRPDLDETFKLGQDFHLVGTGFNLAQEVTRFFENFNQNIRAGKTVEKALSVTAQETEVNIRTFIVEYIQAGAVLPNPSKIGQVNGVNRMVGDNGVPVVDGTTDKERKGSVRSGLMIVDEAVSLSEPGQVAVINSPKGWSGFFDQFGRPIKYKNSQTMVHWIDETSQLRNVTIVSDLEQAQLERLSIGLEVDQAELTAFTEEEKIAAIVAHPALLFFPEFKVSPAEYVLDRILAIRGNSPFRLEQEDGTVEIRSVEDIRKQIQDPEQLLKFNQDFEDHLKILKQFIMAKVGSLNNADTQMQIISAIERTILHITLDYISATSFTPSVIARSESSGEDSRVQSDAVWIPGHNYTGFTKNDSPMHDSDRYDKAAAFLRTRAGCNGGGGSSTRLGSIRIGSASAGSSTNTESSGGICEICRKLNADNHYHCENEQCHKEYADETSVAPENRTKQCSCGTKFGC